MNMLVRCVVYILLCLSQVAAYPPTPNHTFAPRGLDASEVANVRGGLLFKNSKQTSCEIGLISMKAGFIAASCFNFRAGNIIDDSIKYEVYLQTGSSTPLIVPLNPSDIHLHPQFSLSTFQNNIAVIEFNKQSTDSYKAYILTDKFFVSRSSYVRRTINTSTGKWNDNILADMTGNPADCPNYSGLAAGNGDQFACTQLATTSINNPSCTVPFGTLYTRGNNGLIALLGVYSHIVAGGSSLCQGGTLTYTYITELWFLDEFATSVLGYPIDVMSGYDATTQSGTSLHSDNPPKTIDMNGKSMFTGDVYVWEPNTVDNNSDNGSDSDKGSGDDDSKNRDLPVVTSPQPVSSTSSSKPFATNDSNDDKSKSDKTSNDKDSDDPNDSNDDNDKSTKQDLDDNGDETTEDEMAMGEKETSMLTETKYISGDKTSNEDSSMDGLADNKQDEKSSPNEMSNQQANLSDDGLNKTQIIVIAIVVPIVSLFFGFVVYILFRMWKSKQIDKKPWDPLAEANHHREAIFDLGGLGIDSITTTPPPYARHSGSASSINICTPCSSLSKQECISKEFKS